MDVFHVSKIDDAGESQNATECFDVAGTRRCQFKLPDGTPGCGVHDFLPFKCAGCGASFCLAHRSYAAHNCPARPKEKKVAPGTKTRKLKKHACSVKGCKNKEYMRVTCSSCGLPFCLKHKFERDHDCQVAVRERQQRAARAKKLPHVALASSCAATVRGAAGMGGCGCGASRLLQGKA